MELKIGNPKLKEAIRTICESVRRAGGRAFCVGGAVRDCLMGRQSEELDIEVYGLEPSQLERILGSRFEILHVGRTFGVLKIRGLPIDVSLPRLESKTGPGHRGFEITARPELSYEEAASRRDFTVNAMAFDPLTGELIDPFGGMKDIQARVLRHTSEKFIEDPLRVLRAMQFAARFDFEVAPETTAVCRRIQREGLPRERIFEEWRKLICQGIRPSRGLSFLKDCGWIRYWPELEALIGCPQDPEWHPEGDVWVHTLYSMDAFAAEKTGDSGEDLVVGFAVLCHDFGKPFTTRFERGKIRSAGHDTAGEAPTRSFLARMTDQRRLADEVVTLVIHHMRPQQLFRAGAGETAVRRLARRVGRIDRLVRVARADWEGRPGLEKGEFIAGRWLLQRAHELQVQDSAPEPLVKGRHLIGLGLKPGPHFRPILDECYEAQLDGKFKTLEEGILYAEKIIERDGIERDAGGTR